MSKHVEELDLSHGLTPFPTARFIKEIGRGAKGARGLARADAHDLFAAIIDKRVSDLELGAILLSMRIKGESIDELAGFIDAAESSYTHLSAPSSAFMPIVIPTYNGARRAANLTPLLAMLLARSGAPVLIHGVRHDPGRVTTAEILTELGIPFAHRHDSPVAQFGKGLPVFMPIEVLAPRLSELLALRRILGLRNSTHTLVKIIQPFVQPALRLTSYTHPEYAKSLSDYFMGPADASRGAVLLMRATEGETVANVKKVQQIDLIEQHQRTTLCESELGTDLDLAIPADAAGTAAWIKRVLAGELSVPENIQTQVDHCLNAAATGAAR